MPHPPPRSSLHLPKASDVGRPLINKAPSLNKEDSDNRKATGLKERKWPYNQTSACRFGRFGCEQDVELRQDDDVLDTWFSQGTQYTNSIGV